MTTLREYHSRVRTDILDAVPSDARQVLSVGCASGATEEHLLRRGATVAGIELFHEAAAIARDRGIKVIEGDASSVDVAQFGMLFDFIIYADVLEHLPDPEGVIRRHIQHLRPGGCVYVTVPNFRHYSVLWKLAVCGEVIYEDAGILDRTHVRLTTRKMVLRWLNACGLKPLRVRHRFFGRRLRYVSAITGGLFKDVLAQHVAVLAIRPA